MSLLTLKLTSIVIFGKTISIPSDATSATITDTILALTGDTTLKFSGAINAVKLKAIASAMKENDSVQISLDFSETTGITEWKNWFAEIESLYGIALPNTLEKVTYIGYAAFKNCEKLESIVIGANITHIGESAFENCSSLATAVFKDSERTWYAYKNAYDVGSSKIKGKPENFNSVFEHFFDSDSKKNASRLRSWCDHYLVNDKYFD